MVNLPLAAAFDTAPAGPASVPSAVRGVAIPGAGRGCSRCSSSSDVRVGWLAGRYWKGGGLGFELDAAAGVGEPAGRVVLAVKPAFGWNLTRGKGGTASALSSLGGADGLLSEAGAVAVVCESGRAGQLRSQAQRSTGRGRTAMDREIGASSRALATRVDRGMGGLLIRCVDV